MPFGNPSADYKLTIINSILSRQPPRGKHQRVKKITSVKTAEIETEITIGKVYAAVNCFLVSCKSLAEKNKPQLFNKLFESTSAPSHYSEDSNDLQRRVNDFETNDFLAELFYSHFHRFIENLTLMAHEIGSSLNAIFDEHLSGYENDIRSVKTNEDRFEPIRDRLFILILTLRNILSEVENDIFTKIVEPKILSVIRNKNQEQKTLLLAEDKQELNSIASSSILSITQELNELLFACCNLYQRSHADEDAPGRAICQSASPNHFFSRAQRSRKTPRYLTDDQQPSSQLCLPYFSAKPDSSLESVVRMIVKAIISEKYKEQYLKFYYKTPLSTIHQNPSCLAPCMIIARLVNPTTNLITLTIDGKNISFQDSIILGVISGNEDRPDFQKTLLFLNNVCKEEEIPVLSGVEDIVFCSEAEFRRVKNTLISILSAAELAELLTNPITIDKFCAERKLMGLILLNHHQLSKVDIETATIFLPMPIHIRSIRSEREHIETMGNGDCIPFDFYNLIVEVNLDPISTELEERTQHLPNARDLNKKMAAAKRLRQGYFDRQVQIFKINNEHFLVPFASPCDNCRNLWGMYRLIFEAIKDKIPSPNAELGTISENLSLGSVDNSYSQII